MDLLSSLELFSLSPYSLLDFSLSSSLAILSSEIILQGASISSRRTPVPTRGIQITKDSRDLMSALPACQKVNIWLYKCFLKLQAEERRVENQHPQAEEQLLAEELFATKAGLQSLSVLRFAGVFSKGGRRACKRKGRSGATFGLTALIWRLRVADVCSWPFGDQEASEIPTTTCLSWHGSPLKWDRPVGSYPKQSLFWSSFSLKQLNSGWALFFKLGKSWRIFWWWHKNGASRQSPGAHGRFGLCAANCQRSGSRGCWEDRRSPVDVGSCRIDI